MDEKTYRKKIISDMKKAGTYKTEYNRVIDNLAKIYADMDKAREDFIKSGGNFVVKHTNKNGSTNLAKNPFYLTIEGLQSNILAYSRELGLTPMGLKKITGDSVTETKKQSTLAVALTKLEI